MAEKLVGTFGDAVTVYNALNSVGDDLNAFGREAAKWSPDLVYKALNQGAGSAFIKGNYFVSSGINLLDPNLAVSIAKIRMRVIIDKFETKDWLSRDKGIAELAKLRELLNRGKFDELRKEIIMIRLSEKNINKKL